MSRAYATVVTLVLCGAVSAPAVQGFRERPFDDFPLSWYPMFARPRPPLENPVYVVAIDPDGARHKVHQGYWTSGGFNQGATQLIAAAAAGPEALEPLCRRIAEHVVDRRDPALAAARQVRILTGTYSREAWFRDGDHAPMQERTLSRCPVPARR